MVVPVYNNSYICEPVPSIEGDSSVFSSVDQRPKNAEDIEIAVKNVERFIIADNGFPELGDRLKIGRTYNINTLLPTSFFYLIEQNVLMPYS